MKPYMVEITTYGVVMAEDEAHAHQVADSYKREIFGDDWNPRIEVDGAVVKVEDLAHGWDGECIPYGGDGNTKLADLLVPNQTAKRSGTTDNQNSDGLSPESAETHCGAAAFGARTRWSAGGPERLNCTERKRR